MTFVLDSSIVIELEKGNKEIIKKITELNNIHKTTACITFISYFEVYSGIRKKIEKNREKAYNFLQKFPLIYPSKRTAEILAELREKYQEKGSLLPLADMMIVSQVKEHGLLLVTMDRDFEKIGEIRKIILN
jgi:predicted nucleic acid-binding protein